MGVIASQPYPSKLDDPFSSHRRIIDLVRGLPGIRRILDVGCGQGHLGMALSALGCSVVGIDPEAEVDRLRQAAYRIDGVEVTPTPLPLLWNATGEGRPFAGFHTLNAWITGCWKRLLGHQILILATLCAPHQSKGSEGIAAGS